MGIPWASLQPMSTPAAATCRYEPAPATHPSSIMALSNTGGHGRGGQQGSIIGDVINHGKKQFWGVKGMHYHQGMAAGDNTLNALCARCGPRIAPLAGASPLQILSWRHHAVAQTLQA